MSHGSELTLLGQDKSKVSALVIGSEEDAWNFLADMKRDDYAVPDDIIFGDWAKVALCLKGEQWHSSITPSIFPVFQKLQSIINKAYAEAKYGDKNHKLTKEDRKAVEIIIRVSESSSLLEAATKMR